MAGKKFIIEDLDARHLLIKGEVKDEIERKVSEWMDEVCIISIICSFVFANVIRYSFIKSHGSVVYRKRMYSRISRGLVKIWTHRRDLNVPAKKDTFIISHHIICRVGYIC